MAPRTRPFWLIQTAAAVVMAGVLFLWPGPWNLERWIGIIVGVPAGVLLLVARYQLGASFSVTPQARQLVTHGLYSRIRNPMYVFSALMVLGFLLTLQNPYGFAVFAVLLAVQVARAHQESKVLEAKFGDEYREYKKKTWF